MTVKISVVIPSYQRAQRLKECIQALLNQEADFAYEVIVVDNGSTDATASMLASIQDSRLISLRIELNRGPVPARNLGWRSANADIIAFTDDDCIPGRSWLKNIVDCMPNTDVVQGRTEPNPDQKYRFGPFSHTIKVTGESSLFETCNIAYRKLVLDATNGFDEIFHFGGEDTDLGWRARKLGFRTQYCDTAVVFHEITRSNFKNMLFAQAHWRGMVFVAKRHPGLRALFPNGLFWRPLHGPALLAMGGLVVTGASATGESWVAASISASTTIPYVYARIVRYRQRGRLRARLAALPFSLIIDLYGLFWHFRAVLPYFYGHIQQDRGLPPKP